MNKPYRTTVPGFVKPDLSPFEQRLLRDLGAGRLCKLDGYEADDVDEFARSAPEALLLPIGQVFSTPEPIVHRALRDADAEGVAWTPLIDSIAGRAHGHEDVLRERASQMRPWLRDHATSADISDLLDAFRSDTIHREVAGHARCIDPSHVDTLGDVGETALPDLAANPGLSSPSASHLASRVLALIEKCKMESIREPRIKILDALATQQGGMPPQVVELGLADLAGYCKDTRLVSLLLRHDLPHDALLRFATDGYAHHAGEALSHPRADDGIREGVFVRSDLQRVLETGIKGLRGAWFRRGAEILLSHGSAPANLVHHPELTSEMMRRIALPWDGRNKQLVIMLAGSKGALDDPEIRAHIERSSRGEELAVSAIGSDDLEVRFAALATRDARAAKRVLRKVPAGQFAACFSLLAATDPYRTALVLKERGDAVVPAQDLAPLFAAGGEAAQIAVGTLARTRASDSPEASRRADRSAGRSR